jgi:hypothetical protein
MAWQRKTRVPLAMTPRFAAPSTCLLQELQPDSIQNETSWFYFQETL